MKKNLFFLLLTLPFIACSEEFKLSCNTKLITNYSNGAADDVKSDTVIFKITDLGLIKFVTTSNDRYCGVTTDKNIENLNLIFMNDLSDSNQWDISNIIHTNNGVKSECRIVIDRNAGSILHKSIFTWKDGFIMNRSASGNCEKVNLTKKKF